MPSLRLRLDLHVHTNNSYDCRLRIHDIIRFCKSSGLDGFAVTDHDTLGSLAQVQGGDEEVAIIPGMEVTARGAHILAFHVYEDIPPRLPIEETVELIHQQGGTAALAHPYSMFRSSLRELEVSEAGFDALEVANASHLFYKRNLKRGISLAERLKLPMIGGSDAHFLEAVGRTFTIVEADSTRPEDILKAVKEGKTEIKGTGITLFEKLWEIFNF